MGFRINTNIISLSAQRSLSRTHAALARSLERLASGKRINRAGDDASGLAISEGLNSQIRGLGRASQNINDAQSVLQTAEGALAEQTNLVQRMKEIAVQAASGTLSFTDRGYLDTELQKLYQEFQRLTLQSDFNGQKLIDGSFATTTLQVGARKQDTIAFNLNGSTLNNVFTKNVNDGNFNSYSNAKTGSFPAAIQSADVNGDGNKDLITVNQDGTASVLIGKGNGLFNTPLTFSVGEDPADLRLADLNGDGKLDLVVLDRSLSSNTPNVSIWTGKGDGTFARSASFAVGANPGTLAIGDLNGDGIQDIVVGNQGSNTATVLIGQGGGTFTAGATVTVGNGASITLADVNGDGRLDLISADTNDGTASVALGNGDGTFKPRTTYDPQGATSIHPIVGDFDGDGKNDILVLNAGDGTVSFLKGNGDGTFAAGVTSKINSNDARSMDVKDLNGDGTLDLVVANGSDNSLSICYGKGDGTFNFSKTVATGAYAAGVVADDFNNDFNLDLASANIGDDSVSIFEGSSHSVASAGSDISVATQSGAQNLLAILDNALTTLSASRANIGATQSRLNSAANTTMLTVESLSQARSQILDADFATETAELTRNQILQQAGVATLGQANVSMQLVLNLLNSTNRG